MAQLEHPGKHADKFRALQVPVPATVLCCPVRGRENPITMKCLEEYGKESVVLRWLNPDDPNSMKYGMWDAIEEHWTGERDLIHIDHDMVFVWNSLRDLSNCNNKYCACPYWSANSYLTAPLGFSKFSAQLQRELDLDEVRHALDTCVDTDEQEGCYGAFWGVESHLMEAVAKHQELPCNHDRVLNDHSLFGLVVRGVKVP